MKYMLSFVLSCFLIFSAWAMHRAGNDFVAALFLLCGFAPIAAVVALRLRIF